MVIYIGSPLDMRWASDMEYLSEHILLVANPLIFGNRGNGVRAL